MRSFKVLLIFEDDTTLSEHYLTLDAAEARKEILSLEYAGQLKASSVEEVKLLKKNPFSSDPSRYAEISEEEN
jgi:hypothetical protein